MSDIVKKLLFALPMLLALAGAYLVPTVAFATPSSVDRVTDHIQPLILSDFIKAQYFTATSTTAASTLPYASTTVLSATSLCLSTDCRTVWPTAGSSFAYPFGLAGNATSTLTQFNGGLTAYSTSTIGDGTQVNGLTISGGATTTLSQYIGTTLFIGTTTGASTVNISAATAPTMTLTGNSSSVATSFALTDANTSGNSYSAILNPSGTSNANVNTIPLTATFSTGAGTTGGLVFASRPAAASIRFFTGGNSITANLRLTIAGTGEVGIGTTTPGTKLSVNGDSVLAGVVTGQYFMATSTLTASTLPYASTTAITATTASTTNLVISGLGTAAGTILAVNGLGQVIATTTQAGGVTSVTGTWPIISSGGATPNLTFGGLSTSSAAVVGNIPYYSGVNTFANVATSTATISSGLTYSGTWGNEVGGVSGNLTCTTGSATVFGCLTAANFNIFNNKIGTSSTLTNGQLLVAGPGGNTAYSVATSTATCSSGVSCSTFTVVGSVNPSFTNSGVTSIVAGTNITVSGAIGAVTVTGLAYPFTPTSSFGTTAASATSTLMLLTQGLNASTTINFGNAGVASQFTWNSVLGDLGIGSSTPWGTLAISTSSAAALVVADGFNTINALFNNASTTGSIFTVAATTTTNAQIVAGTPIRLFDVDQYGHLTASSTRATPTVSCTPSGGTITANSNDVTGDITGGTLSTACTVTFASAYATTPEVFVTPNSATQMVAVTARSTTAFTISFAAAISNDNVSYFVIQP